MSILEAKRIEALQVGDLKSHPIWEYVDDEHSRDVLVRPSTSIPATTLRNRVVATQVRLASGQVAWALIGNVDSFNPKATEHFITLSVEKEGQWFVLARYHDWDIVDRGPEALARFLGLPMDDVFPIRYDISELAVGDPKSLRGAIASEPRERLTQAEILALAIRPKR